MRAWAGAGSCRPGVGHCCRTDGSLASGRTSPIGQSAQSRSMPILTAGDATIAQIPSSGVGRGACMAQRRLALVIIVVGVLLAFVSLFADPLGVGGEPGFGWK